MEKKLSTELKEVTNELMALCVGAICDVSSLSYMDSSDIEKNVKLSVLLMKVLDLYVRMFEKEEELMGKMDTVLNSIDKR